MSEILCYNKGCGQKYIEADNNESACKHHPGPAVFHDALKIWNCCKKKSTDFNTWLNYPGCALGLHSNVKPDDMVRVAQTTEIRPEKPEDVIQWNGLNKPQEDRVTDRAMTGLTIRTTPGADAALAKLAEQKHANSESLDLSALPIGTPCRNACCDKSYEGPNSANSNCVHHPGTAVFHEGMKYWSCCQKKTSDFNAFMDQKGCTTGDHDYTVTEKVKEVREDWFNNGGFMHVNYYCKGTIPTNSKFTCNGFTLESSVTHGNGKKESNLIVELFAEIDLDESHVLISERKVEIVLKKQDATLSWPKLRYEKTVDVENEEESSESSN